MAEIFNGSHCWASVFVVLTAFYMPLWAQGTADLTEQVAELRALVDQR
jgi:hypothetical protein